MPRGRGGRGGAGERGNGGSAGFEPQRHLIRGTRSQGLIAASVVAWRRAPRVGVRGRVRVRVWVRVRVRVRVRARVRIKS